MRLKQFTIFLGPGLFLMPVLLFGIGSQYMDWGAHEVFYRNSQIVSLLTMGFAALVFLPKFPIIPSSRILTVCLTIIVASLAAMIRGAATGEYLLNNEEFLQISFFCSYLLLVDQFRTYGFKFFISKSLIMVTAATLLTALHFAFGNASMHWGRYFWFWLHPNLGGEVMFVCVIVLAFCDRNYLNLILTITAIILMVLLQSRAALLGSLLVIFLNEHSRVKKLGHIRRTQTTAVAMAVTILFLAVSFAFPNFLPFNPVSYIYSDVLFLDHAQRGVGTDLVGRGEAFRLTWSFLSENPIIGTGLGGTSVYRDQNIHNGFLKLIAELGVFGFFLIYLIVKTAVKSYSRNQPLFIALVACMFVFYFNDRGVNLSVFPLILWILVAIPWKEENEESKTKRKSKKRSIAPKGQRKYS